MRYRLLLITVVMSATLSTISCKKSTTQDAKEDKCAGLLSDPGPFIMALKLIDKDTKENLLLKKNIDTAKIKIVNQKDQSVISKYIHTNNGYVFFIVPEKTENYQIKVHTGKEDPISLAFSSHVKSVECGVDHQLKDVSIDNYPFAVSENTLRKYVLEVGI